MPIADFKDSVTGEICEKFFTGSIPESITNDNGNKADRVYSYSNGIGGMDETTNNRAIAKNFYEKYRRLGRL